MTVVRGPLACALAGTVLLSGCSDKHAEEPPPVRPVLSVIVAPFAPRTFGFTGTVEPRYKADLGFRVLGRLIARNVEVGDLVKPGAQLAAIDPLPLELAVRSSTADVLTARAQVTNATGVEGRQRILAQQNVSTQAQLEGAEQAQDTASASLKRAEANLAKAKEQLGYAQLRSDSGGVVTAVGAQVGQVVQAGQTVVTVARPDIREASVDIPDDIARDLRTDTAFEVALQLDPSIRTPGRVREIAPLADSSTRTRRVRLTLDQAGEVFRLGTTITATLRTEPAAGIDLPLPALLERDGKTLVWVVDPATATVSTREVTVSGRGDSTFLVAEGLAEGTRVVTAGVHSLEPGQRVRIADEASR